MDRDAMIQAAEEEWLSWYNDLLCRKAGIVEDFAWHWFWIILAESIWPENEFTLTAYDFVNELR